LESDRAQPRANVVARRTAIWKVRQASAGGDNPFTVGSSRLGIRSIGDPIVDGG
jgi:hypothetical protein